jgi:hypothetical protein
VKVNRAYLYAMLAVAVTIAYGVGVGPYWVADMLVFAVTAGVVAWFCFFRRAETKNIEAGYGLLTRVDGRQVHRRVEPRSQVTERDQREHVSRSRIAHYVIVSRIKSTTFAAWLRRESDSPFERALLGEPKWRTLSEESLEEITKKAPDASAKIIQ